MSKTYIKEERERLLKEQEDLYVKLAKVDYQLEMLGNMEKPYVACVQSYSGGGSKQFDTYEKALAKMEEYRGKKMFRNGRNYGVYLYKHKLNGEREMLMEIPLNNYYITPIWNKEHEDEGDKNNG